MEPQKTQEKKNLQLNPYIKYSSLGLQMGGTLAICAWGGHWLDEYVQNSKPFFTLGFLLLGTIASILSLIRQLK